VLYTAMRHLWAMALGLSVSISAHAAPLSPEAEPEAEAEAERHPGHGGHSAHVHGVARLQIVLEGSQLDIALLSPAANLVGFEHRPETDDQLAIVALTHRRLSEGEVLFQTEPASCQLAGHSINLSTIDKHGEEDSGEHHNESPSHSSPHREITAQYRFTCAKPDEVRALSTTLMAQFPGIRHLQVQWISDHRQGAATLDNGRHRVILR